MLYEGTLRSLNRALPGFDYDDPATAISTIHNNVEHAREIIRELDRTLNMELGGECAITLRRLYRYFERRLTEGNIRSRREAIEEVIRHVTVLRDAWAEMLSMPAGGVADPAITAMPALAIA